MSGKLGKGEEMGENVVMADHSGGKLNFWF